MDPKVWGQNWPFQYDSYLRTSLPTTTKYGGRGLGASDAGPAEQKLDRDPWLKRIFAGYAFALDYRDRRGHFYALFDQEADPARDRAAAARRLPAVPRREPRRSTASSGRATSRRASSRSRACRTARRATLKDDKGQPLVQHPVACVDCHDPKTMALRVTRPGFIAGIKALKAKQGVADFDPNRDATRQEMRSYVCGQCHVEYYFKGPGKIVTYPWANGLKVEEIEAYYERGRLHGLGPRRDRHQGPEGPAPRVRGVVPGRARPGRRGLRRLPHALRARRRAQGERPLGAQPAPQPEPRLPDLPRGAGEGAGGARAHDPGPPPRAARSARPGPPPTCSTRSWPPRRRGASEKDLQAAAAQHQKAQWRLDFVAAENSMGFHAPQELARILGEVIDHARQGQLEAERAARKP